MTQVVDIEFQKIYDQSLDHNKSINDYIDSSTFARSEHDLEKSLFFLSIANRLVEDIEDDTLKARINYQYARTYSNFDNSELAIPYFENAIKSFSAIKDTIGIANSYNMLGIVYKHNSRYSEAVEVLKYAYRSFYLCRDSTGIGLVQINMGNIFKNTGRPNLAKLEYLKSLNIFIALKDTARIASCYNNLGNIYKNEAQYDSAFYYMYRTVEIQKTRFSIKGLAYIYHNLANLHIETDTPDSALFYISKSFDLKKKLNSNYELANDYEVYGRIYMKKKLWNMAIDNFNMALNLIPENKIKDDFSIIQKSIGLCYYYKGDYKSSSKYLIDYLTIKDTIESQTNINQLEKELIQYELFIDSIKTNQLNLRKELISTRNDNRTLSSEIEYRNLLYLTTILILIFLILAVLLITSRKGLQKSKKHKAILTVQNEELKRTLISKEEKEILLKEVHHRVKNNLQIINSLIRLQTEFMNANNFKEKLIETENRIRSMALIHEKLYKSDNLASLSVRNYIEELAINILESFENDVNIKLKIDIEENEYGIDTLIPIGLIINEVLSNSIKYAFYQRNSGLICISLITENDKTILYIEDNGIGADLTLDELKEDSLGMELIISLTDQLDGVIELETLEGFKYKFSFPIFE